MITDAGEERLIPQWMFDSDAFQPAPVELPLISLDALRHLLRVFSSSAFGPLREGQEGRHDDPIAAVSAACKPKGAAPEQGARRSEKPFSEPADRGVPGEQQATTAAEKRRP